LGQILSLREDLLPKPLTDELKNLLDRLPVVSFERYQELVEADLKRPMDTIFQWIDPIPLGSASLAQPPGQAAYREDVVIKLLKPGVRKQ
jgi:predicted unusual protein kinase regulating ubiquinone biosynthesis (AarF/ABC1/UbiB family)